MSAQDLEQRGAVVSLPALLDPVRFAAAWSSIANVPPSIPSETDYRMRLISKWTRGGKVPTLEEAEAMERASG